MGKVTNVSPSIVEEVEITTIPPVKANRTTSKTGAKKTTAKGKVVKRSSKKSSKKKSVGGKKKSRVAKK